MSSLAALNALRLNSFTPSTYALRPIFTLLPCIIIIDGDSASTNQGATKHEALTDFFPPNGQKTALR